MTDDPPAGRPARQPIPSWLAASGFTATGNDVDWDALAEQLEVDAVFDSAVELATRVLDGPDPWGSREVSPGGLTGEQRSRLGRPE